MRIVLKDLPPSGHPVTDNPVFLHNEDDMFFNVAHSFAGRSVAYGEVGNKINFRVVSREVRRLDRSHGYRCADDVTMANWHVCVLEWTERCEGCSDPLSGNFYKNKYTYEVFHHLR